MVDNIATSGLRRSKLKNNGEEDPVVVIQRLLNIFRQLHVMNDEQKNAFNELILKQPAEIRHMCAVLPGGSLLQEYVDDLEEQTGQVSDLDAEIEEQTLAQNQQNNILAAAMEQNAAPAAQSAATGAPVVQVVDNGASRELQKQMTLIMQELQETKKDLAKVNQQAQAAAMAQMAAQNSSGQASVQPVVMPAATGPATLTTDENFAKEIAAAVTNAFNMAEESRKKETQELAKSIAESQQTISRETQALTKSLAESQQQISKETQELTKTLAESQMQMTQRLISELAQRPVAQGDAPVAYTPASAPTSAEAASGGTNTVYVQSADTREITRAITESQLEMAKMFLQHNAISANAQNNTANNIQINNAPAPAVNTEEVISGIIKAQSKLFQEMSMTQTKELSSVIASALKESQQISTKSMIAALRETQNSSTKTMVETLKAFQKENLKFFEKQAKMMPKQTIAQVVAPAVASVENAAPVTYAENIAADTAESESKTSYIKSVLTKNFSKLMRHSGEETISTEPDNFIETEETDGFSDMSAAETEPETVVETIPEVSETAEEHVFESPAQDFSVQEEILPERTEVMTASSEEAVISEEENALPELAADEDNDIMATEENSEQNFDGPTKKKRKKKKKKKRNSADNAAFSVLSEEILPLTDDLPTDNNLSAENQKFALDTSLFDLDLPENAVSPEDGKNQLSGLDMSLFADDEPEQNLLTEESVTPEEAIEAETIESLADTAKITEKPTVAEGQSFAEENILSSAEEEISEEGFLPTKEAAEPIPERRRSSFIPDTTSTDDLYSLYSDTQLISENDTPVNLEAATEEAAAEDEGEWTWEYEDSDDTAGPHEATAATDDNAEGEWEWEYEEVDENGETPAMEAAETTADDNAEGEWEWEYEEVDENDETPATEAAETTADDNAEGEWEWEYEDSDEPDQTAEEQTGDTVFKSKDDLATMFDDDNLAYTESKIGDPYTGESRQAENELGFSPLQSGSLYFQEDVEAEADKLQTPVKTETVRDTEIIIPESGIEENNFDPYAPNSGIK